MNITETTRAAFLLLEGGKFVGKIVERFNAKLSVESKINLQMASNLRWSSVAGAATANLRHLRNRKLCSKLVIPF